MKNSVYANIGITSEEMMKLASFLLFEMKNLIKFRNSLGNMEPLFTVSHMKSKKSSNYIGTIVINSNFLYALTDQIDKKNSFFIQLDRSLPMIYPPAPWQDNDIGGYYLKPTNLMRIKESKMQEKAVRYADLYKLNSVLDILSNTPWRINKKILNVVRKVWENGGGLGEIPKRHYDYNNYTFDYQLKECFDLKKRKAIASKIQEQRDVHSLRCDFILKLNVANAFENIERIYFPQNVDFRGRIYPLPPNLNHLGADISRGLLEFGEGKPLGKEGLYWLKIHLSNKMGNDKLPFEDRLAFVENRMREIENCVRDPLRYQEWLSSEDSWQTLAAMFEVS
jgi:DNA-directed RNA polymerase, mitochondrial